MKKIVAVASLASLLAGAAFAADISFSYTGENYFQSNGDNVKSIGSYQDLVFGLSGDVAGAEVELELYNGQYGDEDSITAEENDRNYNFVTGYYGWMNFGENLQFKAGVYTSRDVNRVNKDAGDLDGEDFELNKPGVVNGTVAKDSANLTEGNLAMQAQYKTAGLTFKGVLVNGEWDGFTKGDAKTEDKETRTNSYGFAGSVGYSQEDSFDALLAIRSLHVGNYSFGLFFSPKMIENLDATVGFSLGLDTYDKSKRAATSSKAYKDETGVEFGIDLRARYAISEKLSVTTMHNLSNYLIEKNGDNLKWDNALGMWNMLNFNYKYAANMTAGISLNSYIDNFKDSDKEAKDGRNGYLFDTIYVSPYWTIQATEKIAVTVAARATWEQVNILPTNETFELTIPVIFSYNY